MRSIGDYVVVKQLGETVYQATNGSSTHTLKAQESSDTPELVALRTLQHPNIVCLEDVLVNRPELPDEPPIFAVMEYVAGQTLRQYCKTRDFPPSFFFHITQQLCSTLAYIHGQGFVFNDLSPGNLIMQHAAAKLIDLEGCTSSTDPAYVIGTPGFRSPAQLDGHSSTTNDIFGLGALFYFMIEKIPPFPGYEYEIPESMEAAALKQGVRKKPAFRDKATIDLVCSMLAPSEEARPKLQGVAALLRARSYAYPPFPLPSSTTPSAPPTA